MSGTPFGPVGSDESPALLPLASQQAVAVSTTVSTPVIDRGTVFPATPTDKQEFVYVASATDGVNWTFKYNNGSASSFKWEAASGQTPLWSEVTAGEARANVAYGALTTPGPVVILPFAGDYDIVIGFSGNVATAGELALMSYDIGGTGAVTGDAVELTSTNATNGALNDYTAVVRPRRQTGLTAVTLTAKYRTGGGTSTFKNRWMSVTPVRVSA